MRKEGRARTLAKRRERNKELRCRSPREARKQTGLRMRGKEGVGGNRGKSPKKGAGDCPLGGREFSVKYVM